MVPSGRAKSRMQARHGALQEGDGGGGAEGGPDVAPFVRGPGGLLAGRQDAQAALERADDEGVAGGAGGEEARPVAGEGVALGAGEGLAGAEPEQRLAAGGQPVAEAAEVVVERVPGLERGPVQALPGHAD